MTKLKTPRTKHASTSIADQTTAYAVAVTEGKIIAGPHVRLACKRHLLDLEHGPKRGLRWDVEAAQDVIGFFADVLQVIDGDRQLVPFPVFGWQAFCLGSIFGWKRADGSNRFQIFYIETGKGSGKTPMLAGIGVYMLVALGKYGVQIYAAATHKDQAMIMFRDAVQMVKQSTPLWQRLRLSGGSGNEWNIAYHDKESFFRPVSSEEGQSGRRVFGGFLDELHEHRDQSAINMMVAGTKGIRDALVGAITNSGSDLNSVCWAYHESTVRAIEVGVYGSPNDAGWDDSRFGYVCALDAGDKEFEDESCWPKVNPSLEYGLPSLQYLREQVKNSRNMPSQAALVRRLNFCIWTEAENPWIGPEIWKQAEQPYPIEKLAGRKCYGGLDLSSTTDLTAFVLQFEPVPDDPVHRLLAWFWLPNDGLFEREEKDRVPYVAWKEAGYLLTTPGPAIDQLFVARKCQELCQQFDVQAIGFDRAFIKQFIVMMERADITLPLVEYGQNYTAMAPAVNEFERRLLSGNLKHDGNPILRWNFASAVIQVSDEGMRKLSKRRARSRIDGAVAVLDSTGVGMAEQEKAVVHTADFIDLNQ